MGDPALAVLGILACLTLGGCWLPHQLFSDCRKLTSSPSLMAFEVYGPNRSVKGRPQPVRDTVYIYVYESRGVSLVINTPWFEWCERVPEADFRAWLGNAAILSREAPVRGTPGATEELIGVTLVRDDDDQGGLLVVDELSAAGLEAVQELLCLARKAFGSRLTNTTLAITPQLAARVGFPDTCPPVPDGS